MTVKLAKIFTNNSMGSGFLGASMAPPPPLPTPIATVNLHNNFYQQQLQQQRHYNPYILRSEQTYGAVVADEEEIDNMSIYSGHTSNMLTNRDHPYNNSQRPLLAERKPQFVQKFKPSKQKQKEQVPVQNQQQESARQQQQQQQQHEVQQVKSYLPAYVAEQKRDTAKGLHGFNDFDMLSQQYNQHLLQSPHIGYPYGSPPSPTAHSRDFVFDAVTANPIYSNIPAATCSTVSKVDYYKSETRFRFEDDFCTNNGNSGGPFLFGVPPDQRKQQEDINPCNIPVVPHGGNTFRNIDDTVCNEDLERTAKSMTQSSTDTSSSSRDGSHSGLRKFLLRKRKSTKTKKVEKETTKTEVKTEQLTKQPTIKCVVVGDAAVGKTNLILSYLENRFNSEHVPTASDIYNADVMVNESPVHLTLCDTAGQDTLDPLRELCYPDSDVFLLCFSVAKPETFHSIKTKWAPKFAKSKASLLLIGTQADLRTNPTILNKLQANGQSTVSYADAWDLASTIGAKYIETSSVTQEKVKDVFDTAIWEGLLPAKLPPTPSWWRKLFCLV